MRLLLAGWLLTVAGAAVADAPVPLLWKVEKEAGTVYLLGSFHMLKPSDYPLSPAIDAAFDDAEHVLFEVAPAEDVLHFQHPLLRPALRAALGKAPAVINCEPDLAVVEKAVFD